MIKTGRIIKKIYKASGISKAMEQQQCIFCGIASGQIPSKKIYEDDRVIAVLDIYPANPAHLLVLTKKHYAIFNQIPKDEVAHLAQICRRISELLFKVVKPEGINFFIANGPVAGQKAPHMILHAIPRFAGDGLNLEIPENPGDEKEIEAFHSSLKKTLKDYFPNVDFSEAEPKEEKKEEKEEEEKQEKEKKQEEKEKEEEINLDELTEKLL